MATIEVLGRRVSCAGGYFRLPPYQWSRWCLSRLAGDAGRTAAFYFHPWESAPGKPKVRGLPFRSKLRHYSGLSAMKRKLKRPLADFRWKRMDRLFRQDRWQTTGGLTAE